MKVDAGVGKHRFVDKLFEFGAKSVTSESRFSKLVWSHNTCSEILETYKKTALNEALTLALVFCVSSLVRLAVFLTLGWAC